jgi:CyaY protein
MTETEFMKLVDATLSQIEDVFDSASAVAGVDIECARSGNVLEIEFIDNDTKIIVNSQTAMQEIWVASKSGGFHFKLLEGKWLDTRDSSELFAALSKMASAQAGCALALALN